jgi:DNA-binding NarL/FixJ family response regulator
MREGILVIFSVLVLLIVVLLTTIVLLLRKRKNILEQKVMDQEQQYAKLAFELKQFYGKDISALLQDIADAKAKNIKESKLTKREQEIVKLLCEGYRGKEIADKLFISIRAVNSHKTNIFNKLGLSSSVELVRFALEHGII